MSHGSSSSSSLVTRSASRSPRASRAPPRSPAARRCRARPRRARRPRVGDRDHRRPVVHELGAAIPPTFPNPWTRTVAPRGSTGRAQRAERHHHAAAGGLVPVRAADRDRLARDHAGTVAGVDGVGVHHPGHGLLVRADVRRRHVPLRADDREDLGGVPAGDPLQLVTRQSRGLQRTPPLAPPYGSPISAHFQVIHIASARTRPDHVGVVAHAALGRADTVECWTRYPGTRSSARCRA